MTESWVRRRIALHPVGGSTQDMRRAFDVLIGPGPDGIEDRPGGIDAIRHGNGPDVLWFHGGGYVFGSPESHAKAAAFLAREARCRVWLPRYRLAPEHPWPAPLEDALAVLDAFESPVGVVGDSAGGHLALNLTQRAPDRVSRLALISPNTDRTGQSVTRDVNTQRDAMNDDAQDRELARMAMPDMAVDAAEASPLLGPLDRLPPIYLTAATAEVLLDDTLLLARRIALAGAGVTLDIVPGLFHMWPLWPDLLAPARVTLTRIASFLNDGPSAAERDSGQGRLNDTPDEKAAP